MCCPSGFERDEALKILSEMENRNEDGCGYSYLNGNGEFEINKYALSFSDVLEKRLPFLDHMPYYYGWTIIHLRSASCGKIKQENSHPFLSSNRNFCTIHNGHYSDSKVIKLCLSNDFSPKGETDSELLSELIGRFGPRKFFDAIDYAGVFASLHKSGELFVIKSSGQLEFNYSKNKKVLISSELSYKDYPKSLIAMNGLYKFSKNGHFISYKPSETFNTNNQYDWLNKSKRSINVKVLPAKIPFHHQLPSYYENFVD